MAETTADVRRDIEMTRERMSDTLAELERRLNLMEVVRDHPWPAIALAAGAGFALSGTRADVKAAGVTAAAAHGATERASRLGPMLDDLVARLIGGVQDVLMERADEFVAELRTAIGGAGAGRRAAGGAGASGSAAGAYGATSDAASGATSGDRALGAGASSLGPSGDGSRAGGAQGGSYAGAQSGAGWSGGAGASSGAAFASESRDAGSGDASAGQLEQRPLRAD